MERLKKLLQGLEKLKNNDMEKLTISLDRKPEKDSYILGDNKKGWRSKCCDDEIYMWEKNDSNIVRTLRLLTHIEIGDLFCINCQNVFDGNGLLIKSKPKTNV